MPVTTRSQGQSSAIIIHDSSQLNRHEPLQERLLSHSAAPLITPSITSCRPLATENPLITSADARKIPKLDGLPTEIIEIIAQLVRAESKLEESDGCANSAADDSKYVVPGTSSPCYCQHHGLDRATDETTQTLFRTRDLAISLSCVSRRLRDAVFYQRRRWQIVNFCDASLDASRRISDELRGRVR
jgi:hypothetical protein